jgi:4'-phosphopantetheinyl transferase
MWTIKEAYTKALGIGLGFDFKRVEFDARNKVIRVDGETPMGWSFKMFVLKDNEDTYEGVVAEFLGNGRTEVVYENDTHEWLKQYDAVSFVENVIKRFRVQ